MPTRLCSMAGSDVARMNMRLRYAGDIEALWYLRYAGDIEALWYLRTDLFSTLVPLRGEHGARGVIDQVTQLFQGQLPRALRPAQAAPHTPS